MTTVADLTAFLGMNSSGFVSGMRDAGNATKGLGQEAQSTKGHIQGAGQATKEAGQAASDSQGKFAGLKDHMSSLGDTAKTLAPALVGIGGALAGAFAVKDAISSTQEIGSEVRKLSTNMGLSAEDASKLHFQFEETGVSFEAGEKGLRKFEKALAGVTDLEDGVAIPTGKAMAANLEAMGIKTEDAAGKTRSMTDILGDTAEVFKNMPNGVEKTALATQLFGKAGTDLIPMLNKGRDGLAELGDEAEKFGLVLDQKTLNSLKEQKMAQREFSAALEGIKVQIGIALIPVLTFFAQKATELAVAFNHVVIPALKLVISHIRDLLVPAMHMAEQVLNAGLRVAFEAIGKVIDYVSEPIKDFIGTLSGLVKLDFSSGHIVDGFKDLGFAVLELAYELGVPGPLIDILIEKFNQFVDLAAEFASGVAAGAVVVFDQLAAGAAALWPVIQSLAERGFNLLGQAVGYLVDKWNGLPQWAKTAIEVGAVATAFIAVAGPVLALGAAVLYVIGRWDELNEKFPQIKTAIGIVTDAVDVLKKQFEKFNNDVVPALRNVGVAIAAVVAAFALPFIAVGMAIEQTVREHFDNIMNIVRPALDAVITIIRTNLEIVRDIFSVIFALLRGDWQGAWDGLKQLLQDAWNGMLEIVRTQVDLLVALVKNIPVLILALTENFVQVFVDIGQKMISGLAGALTGGWADIRDAIWSLKDSAIAGLGNAFDWMIGVGQNIIDGLKSGMESKLGDLRSWVQDKLDPRNWDIPGLSPLPDAMTHAGGIAGTNLTTGLSQAIVNGAGQVVRATQNMVSQANQALQAAAAAAPTNQLGLGPGGPMGGGGPAMPAGQGGYYGGGAPPITRDANGNINGVPGWEPKFINGQWQMTPVNYGGTAPGSRIPGTNEIQGQVPGSTFVPGRGWVQNSVLPYIGYVTPTSVTPASQVPDYVTANAGRTASLYPGGSGLEQHREQLSITIQGDVNINNADPASANAAIADMGYATMDNLRARGLM